MFNVPLADDYILVIIVVQLPFIVKVNLGSLILHVLSFFVVFLF